MRGEIRRATNHAAWAIGTPSGVGFHVRRVVWGQLMAVAEKREGEEIRACRIMVEAQYSPRKLPKLFDSVSVHDHTGGTGDSLVEPADR